MIPDRTLGAVHRERSGEPRLTEWTLDAERGLHRGRCFCRRKSRDKRGIEKRTFQTANSEMVN